MKKPSKSTILANLISGFVAMLIVFGSPGLSIIGLAINYAVAALCLVMIFAGVYRKFPWSARAVTDQLRYTLPMSVVTMLVLFYTGNVYQAIFYTFVTVVLLIEMAWVTRK